MLQSRFECLFSMTLLPGSPDTPSGATRRPIGRRRRRALVHPIIAHQLSGCYAGLYAVDERLHRGDSRGREVQVDSIKTRVESADGRSA
jgi:hypothetical protein